MLIKLTNPFLAPCRLTISTDKCSPSFWSDASSARIVLSNQIHAGVRPKPVVIQLKLPSPLWRHSSTSFTRIQYINLKLAEVISKQVAKFKVAKNFLIEVIWPQDFKTAHETKTNFENYIITLDA